MREQRFGLSYTERKPLRAIGPESHGELNMNISK